MKTGTISAILKAIGDTKVGRFSVKHAPQISIGVGTVLGAGALVSTAYATKRSITQLDKAREDRALQINADNAKMARAEKEKHPDQPRPEYPIVKKEDISFTKKEVVGMCWKNYTLPAALATGSVVSYGAAYKLEHHKTLFLAGMVSSSEAKLAAMEHEMIEKIGEKKAEEIVTKVVTDQSSQQESVETVETQNSSESEQKKQTPAERTGDLFKITEAITGHEFDAKTVVLKLALSRANARFSDYDNITLNEWLCILEEATGVPMPRSSVGENLVVVKKYPGETFEDYVRLAYYELPTHDPGCVIEYRDNCWKYVF